MTDGPLSALVIQATPTEEEMDSKAEHPAERGYLVVWEVERSAAWIHGLVEHHTTYRVGIVKSIDRQGIAKTADVGTGITVKLNTQRWVVAPQALDMVALAAELRPLDEDFHTLDAAREWVQRFLKPEGE